MNRRAFCVASCLLALCAAAASGDARAAEAQGIVEPLLESCELETHLITDACTGAGQRARSARFDLNAFTCQHAGVIGDEVGLVCPALDVREISAVPMTCPMQVTALDVAPTTSGTLVHWTRIPCPQSYDLIYGVLGVPVVGACLASASCQPGWYCDKFPGDCAGVGQCQPRPRACTAVYDPVCGCDGYTYSSGCVAAFEGVSIACEGLCPCPAACTAADGCLDIGPVVCRVNDLQTASPNPSLTMYDTPAVGQIHFYLVRGRGTGSVGVTTYGTTSDGRERLFAGDCPR